ncbi:RNA polymerase sigma factor [Rubripirellula reticaptiva]|uniref:RNA polymerase sigma factor SigM n=1 Tax=Rubripirellula reticaptiva TaxID=2528013 RepID=A0A5C6EI53_9BACT|nr:sigma-70 family RNA polymerase sigma factor [Rubripirellula reticaptiva]TWU48174.1 RNA polymerase sigma factor SigM [Rubripirellula reticaptiva]
MSSQGSHERVSGSVGDAAGAGASGIESTGDAAELLPAELIARHQRGIWRYLRMLGCDDSMADDLTQETFLRVLRRDNFVQHSEAATSSYLRRTAYNLLVSDHRKHKRVQSMAESPLMDEIWDRWAGKDLSGDRAVDALKGCLSILTNRARLALQMRYGNDATRIEIAEALDITDHGARNLMQRAKGQLRECVEAKLHLNIDH